MLLTLIFLRGIIILSVYDKTTVSKKEKFMKNYDVAEYVLPSYTGDEPRAVISPLRRIRLNGKLLLMFSGATNGDFIEKVLNGRGVGIYPFQYSKNAHI